MKRIFISTFCIVSLCAQNIAYAFIPGSMPSGGVAVMHANDCSETDYTATGNTDGARGSALLSAAQNAVNGDVLYLTPGVFNIDGSTIDMSDATYTSLASTSITYGSGNYTAFYNGYYPAYRIYSYVSNNWVLSYITGNVVNDTSNRSMEIHVSWSPVAGATQYKVVAFSWLADLPDWNLSYTTSNTSMTDGDGTENGFVADGMLYDPSFDIHGSGMASTTITDNIGDAGSVIKAGAYSQLTDLTLNSTASQQAGDNYAFPYFFGKSSSGGPVNDVDGSVWMKNVIVNGFSDGIFWGNQESSLATLTLIGVTVNDYFDTIQGGQGGILNIFDSHFNAQGGTYFNSPGIARGIVIHSQSMTTVFNSTINIGNAPNQNSGFAVYDPSQQGSVVNIYGGSVAVQGTSSLAFYDNASNAFGISPSVTYDHQKTTGATTSISEVTEVVPVVPAEKCPNPFAYSLPPSVTNSSLTNINQTSATLNASIASDSSASSTIRGFAYGLTNNYGATTTERGVFGAGSFSTTLSSLACGTTYHYLAYAHNSGGTGISSDATFQTSACSSTGSGGASSYVSSGVSGGTVSPAQLAAILAPSPATSAYLDALNAQKVTSFVPSSATTTASSSVLFGHNLFVGSAGNDVFLLQKYLNAHGYTIALSGVGSEGHETYVFGNLTKQALIRFQNDHQIQPAVGYFGPITRKVLNNLNSR